jgi:hypothetical protein
MSNVWIAPPTNMPNRCEGGNVERIDFSDRSPEHYKVVCLDEAWYEVYFNQMRPEDRKKTKWAYVPLKKKKYCYRCMIHYAKINQIDMNDPKQCRRIPIIQ